MGETYEFLRDLWYVQYLRSQSWKYTVKYLCSEHLENPTSTVANIFNSLGGIFGEIFKKKVNFYQLF